MCSRASRSSADAGDRRRTVVAPAPFVPVPVFTWTGFYVGANAGWGFSDTNTDNAAKGKTAQVIVIVGGDKAR